MGNSSAKNEKLNDKDYDGQDFTVDPQLREGPMTDRKCTDCCFALLFIAFMCGYGFTCFYAFTYGQPDQLFRPVNGDGKLCGVGDLVDYPKLYYIVRSTDPNPRAVCVDFCPQEITSTFNCHGTAAVSKSDCEKEFTVTGQGHIGYGTHPLLKKFCLPDPDKLPPQIDLNAYDNLIGEFGMDDIQEIGEDIIEAKMVFFYCFLTCFVVTMIYACFIYYLTGVVVWLSIICTGVGIFGMAYLLNNFHNDNYGPNSPQLVTATSEENYGAAVKIGVYVLLVLGVIYFIALCCLFDNIAVSVAVLKTSSVILIQNVRVYTLPFMSTWIIFGWIMWWLYAASWFVSTGTITQPKAGAQMKSVEFTDEQKYMFFAQVFAFFWVYEFVQAVFSYILIVAVSTWYFSSTQDTRGAFSMGKGFKWAIWYNFGSLALGSMILAIIWIIRITLEYIDSQLTKAKEQSDIVRYISICMRCCLSCFHRFIKFINANAYIQVALTGENFCASAMAAFVLMLKNIATFTITNGIGSLIFFLGKMTISMVNTLIGYILITNIDSFKEDIDNPLPVLVVIFVISLSMASVFMNLYDITSLTVLQCLYADIDICKQQNENPTDNSYRPKEMNGIVNMLYDD